MPKVIQPIATLRLISSLNLPIGKKHINGHNDIATLVGGRDDLRNSNLLRSCLNNTGRKFQRYRFFPLPSQFAPGFSFAGTWAGGFERMFFRQKRLQARLFYGVAVLT
jgi:hypothetical protein